MEGRDTDGAPPVRDPNFELSRQRSTARTLPHLLLQLLRSQVQIDLQTRLLALVLHHGPPERLAARGRPARISREPRRSREQPVERGGGPAPPHYARQRAVQPEQRAVGEVHARIRTSRYLSLSLSLRVGLAVVDERDVARGVLQAEVQQSDALDLVAVWGL